MWAMTVTAAYRNEDVMGPWSANPFPKGGDQTEKMSRKYDRYFDSNATDSVLAMNGLN